MKALSIRQPWASLIISGAKDIENRAWNTSFRGRILVHAGKVRPTDALLATVRESYGVVIPDNLPLGGIIGSVDVVEVVTEHPSRWFNGPYGFVLSNPRQMTLVPYSGRLKLFDIDLPPTTDFSPLGADSGAVSPGDNT